MRKLLAIGIILLFFALGAHGQTTTLMKLNVRPSMPGKNMVDVLLANSEQLSDLPFRETFFSFGSDDGNIRFSQLSPWILGALLVPKVFPEIFTPALCDHIPHIITLRSKEKMARIHARGIITAMENTLALWYRPKMQFPTYTMGTDLTASPTTALYGSISPIGSSASPEPARFSLIDLFPKSFFKCFLNRVVCMVTLAATKFTSTISPGGKYAIAS